MLKTSVENEPVETIEVSTEITAEDQPAYPDSEIRMFRGQRVCMLKGMLLPDEIRAYRYWTPARHAVLWNEYVKWVEGGMGSKREFCETLAHNIREGLIPIFRTDVADTYKGEITWQSIQSQIDVFFQVENQALVKAASGRIICNPSALCAITYKQKAEEAKRSYENRKKLINQEPSKEAEQEAILGENLETNSEPTKSVSGDLEPTDSAELGGILNAYGSDSMEYKFALVTAKIHKIATATEGLAELVKSMTGGNK